MVQFYWNTLRNKICWPGGLLVTECIILPVVSASALTWFIRYIYYWNLQFLNNVNINAYVTLDDLGFISPKTLNYLAFQSFDFERTWWRLFQKRVERTRFDMYVFMSVISLWEQATFQWDDVCFVLYTNTLNWSCVLIAYWNSKVRVNMSLQSDALSRFLANQSLLLLFKSASLIDKQHI